MDMICNYRISDVLYNGVEADYFTLFDSTLDDASSWVTESIVCLFQAPVIDL